MRDDKQKKSVDESQKSSSYQGTTLSLQKGDVFIVQDNKGETTTHIAIKAGLQAAGNTHPSMVHAGIMLDAQNTIEMSGNGIGHFTLNDMHGQKIIIFRFKDQAINDLAADLAYNMEGLSLAKDYPKLAGNNPPHIEYALTRAMKSAFNGMVEITEQQRQELISLIDNFNFQDDGAIKNSLFCSEFVVLLFAMSRLILTNSQQTSTTPMACNLHFTNPSQLYDHLCQQPGWERIEFQVIRHGNTVTLLPTSTNNSVSMVAGLAAPIVHSPIHTSAPTIAAVATPTNNNGSAIPAPTCNK